LDEPPALSILLWYCSIVALVLLSFNRILKQLERLI